MTKTQSALQLARKLYEPKLPKALQGIVAVQELFNKTNFNDVKEQLNPLFPGLFD